MKAEPLVLPEGGVVWGLPGVGTSTALRNHRPDVPWFEYAADLVLPSGPARVNDVPPDAIAKLTTHPHPVWMSSWARPLDPSIPCVEVHPRATETMREWLAQSFRQAGRPMPEDLAASVLGLPEFALHAERIVEVLGRAPSPLDWLEWLPTLAGRLDRCLVDLPDDVGARVAAFHGPMSVEWARAAGLRLDLLRYLRDHGIVQALKPGVFLLHPLFRARLVQQRTDEIEHHRDRLWVDMSAFCRSAWEELHQGGTPIVWSGELEDLLAAVRDRISGWETMLAVAAHVYPRLVPVSVTHQAVGESSHPGVHRAHARVLRFSGRLERAETALRGLEDDPDALRELGALLHRRRRVEEAKEAYNRALHKKPVGRGAALVRGNLAALEHDVGDVEAAGVGYRHAIQALDDLGDVRMASLFRANFGVLRMERSDHAEARSLFTVALDDLDVEDPVRVMVLGNLAWLCIETERYDEADALLTEALGQKSDHRTHGTLLARRAVLLALRGRVDACRDAFQEATLWWSTTDDGFGRDLLALYRGFEDHLFGRRVEAAERISRAAPLRVHSDDARMATALLQQLLREAPGSWLVDSRGRTARSPDGATVNLSKGAHRILACLAQHRVDDRGTAVSVDALVEAGWPGERIVEKAAKNRLHVALNHLRKAGLRSLVLRGDGGYLLDPAVPVFLSVDGGE